MKYAPLSEYVSLSQGLVVNKSTEHLFSDIQNEEFALPLLRIVDFENGNHANYSRYVSKNAPDKVILHERDIVFTRVTCQCFRGFKGVFHNNLFKVDLLNDELDEDYLYVVLKSEFVKQQALKLAFSSVVPDLSHNMFKSIIIPVPEKNIQKKIAYIYLNYDRKIELNNSICADLKAMAKQIYDYWFVQFDFPDKNDKPYKSSGGKMVWCKELNRDIPEEWLKGKIKDLGLVVGGATPSTKENQNYADYGIAWATPKDLADSSNVYFTHGERDISETGLKSCSATLIPAGSVLMTSRAPIGYLAISANEVCTNQGFKSVVPSEGISSIYVYFTLQTMMPYIKKYGVGSTFAEVSKEDVENLDVVIPSIYYMNAFNRRVTPLFDNIHNLEMENQQLIELREFLLPMLMNGQVLFK